jgi:hypothetical protein
LLNKKIDHKLKTLFIQKTTELYVEQQLGVESSKDEIKKTLEYNNYLFPMSLVAFASEELDLEEFINSVKEYFGFHFISTSVVTHWTSSKIKISCAKEVMYQLVFSLIRNIIRFMEDQNNLPKTLSLSFLDEKMTISYDSFPLNEEKMVILSQGFSLEEVDVFFLNCKKIFKSLKEHKLDYSVSNAIGQNTISIFWNSAARKKNTKDNIIKFAKYRTI